MGFYHKVYEIIVDIDSAKEALELPIHTILHSGPLIEWDRMCGPQKRAVLGAIQFEGWADDEDGAIKLLKKDIFGLPAKSPDRLKVPSNSTFLNQTCD